MADDDLTTQILGSGVSINTQVKGALVWLAEQIRKVGKFFKSSSMPEIGSMYLFSYDPKLKKTLPFYDAYPLVIPIQYYPDGFLGLNLHYLPPVMRAGLLDSLTKLANNDKYDETTKLNISYRLLKGYASHFPGYDTCVKRYLFGHVRSSFNLVNPEDWAKIVLLPLQDWRINNNQSRRTQAPPY